MAGEKAVALTKVESDYLYMLLTIHEEDPDAPAIKQKLDVIRAEWDAEFEAQSVD